MTTSPSDATPSGAGETPRFDAIERYRQQDHFAFSRNHDPQLRDFALQHRLDGFRDGWDAALADRAALVAERDRLRADLNTMSDGYRERESFVDALAAKVRELGGEKAALVERVKVLESALRQISNYERLGALEYDLLYGRNAGVRTRADIADAALAPANPPTTATEVTP